MANPSSATRVLLVDDDEDAFVLTRAMLDESRREFELDWVDTYETGLDRMLTNAHDICLVDYMLGAETGLSLLHQARAAGFRTPTLLLTNQDDLSVDVAAMDEGAADYLTKGSISSALLERSIRYAIRNRQQADELEALAQRDPLTNLLNARTLRSRLEEAIERAKRNQQMVALLYLDLDKFKPINDKLGHQMGDEALVEVTSRMQVVLRSTDHVARMGGDEFAVVLETNVSEHSAYQVARKLQGAICRPYNLGGHEVTLGVSIGIALYPDTADDARGIEIAADQAMYRAKRSERGIQRSGAKSRKAAGT